jgi:hypothetical protein
VAVRPSGAVFTAHVFNYPRFAAFFIARFAAATQNAHSSQVCNDSGNACSSASVARQ